MRFIANPFYVKSLKKLSGKNEKVNNQISNKSSEPNTEEVMVGGGAGGGGEVSTWAGPKLPLEGRGEIAIVRRPPTSSSSTRAVVPKHRLGVPQPPAS